MIAYIVFKQKDIILEWHYVDIKKHIDPQDNNIYLIADAMFNNKVIGLPVLDNDRYTVIYGDSSEEWHDIFTISKLAGNDERIYTTGLLFSKILDMADLI